MTATTTTTTLAAATLAARLYPDYAHDADFVNDIGEMVAAFNASEGRDPRSAAELDAYADSAEKYAEFLKANPVTAPTPTVPSKSGSILRARTPSVPVQPVLTVAQLANMSRKGLGEMFAARFGFAMPQGWNRMEAATAYMGTAFKAGTNGKKCAQWHYTNKAGISPAKSWTVKKLTAEVAKDVPTLPRGKGSKAEATAAYIAATGYLPAKSWTIAQIVANTDAKKLPARNAVKA